MLRKPNSFGFILNDLEIVDKRLTLALLKKDVFKSIVSFVTCLYFTFFHSSMLLILLFISLLLFNLYHLGLFEKPKNAVAIIKIRITAPIVQTKVLGALYDP